MINAVMAFVVLLLIALGLYVGSSPSNTLVMTPNDNTDVPSNAPPITGAIVPTNPATWPQGDAVWDCCRAIAFAEGYNVANSNPARLNNPGDISDGASRYGSEFHSGSNITKFPDAATGWSWLYQKIANAAAGVSHVYQPSMTWLQIGAIWAPPNASVWASNVANALGVDVNSTLGQYVNGA